MQQFIAINGRDCTSFGESLRLSRVRLIFDGASGCVHVARRRDGVASICPLDLDVTIAVSRGVHRSRLIVTVITPLMDRRD